MALKNKYSKENIVKDEYEIQLYGFSLDEFAKESESIHKSKIFKFPSSFGDFQISFLWSSRSQSL
jgi:hypothetical protein